MQSLTTIWVVLSLALVFSIMLTPFSMKLAHWLGALDYPCDRSVHTVAIPRLGGVGVGLSLLFAASFYLSFNSLTVAYLTGLLIISMTGLIDDIKPISHRFKFAGEIAAVSVFILLSGSQLTGVGNLLGFGEIEFGSLSFIVTVFCMVGVINALNLSDGLDGLAGGMAIIASLFFAFIALKTGQEDCVVIALSLIGSLLGFLLYNGFPARLFMGDVGSLLIGYTCAVLAVQLASAPSDIVIKPITIALILAVPIIDTLIVMTGRMLKGHGPFMPDRTHLHHRLMALGLSQNQVVSILYGLMFLFGMFAVLQMELQAYWLFYIAIAMTSIVYRLISYYSDKPYRVISFASIVSEHVCHIEKTVIARLYGMSGSFTRAISYSLALLLLLPILFLGSNEASLVVIISLLLLGLMIFLRSHNGRIQAIVHGLLYICVLSVLFLYDTSLQEEYWSFYQGVLISVSLAWVTLTLLVAHTRRILALHSFEILLMLVSWIVFFIAIPMMDFVPTHGEDMRLICVYAIPLLLVLKLCASTKVSEQITSQVL